MCAAKCLLRGRALAETGSPANHVFFSLEMLSAEALQHFPRFKNSFPGQVDMSICALDASAHLGNIDEAVVEHVIDVVRYAFDGRDAQILDPLSAVRIRVTFHDAALNPRQQAYPFSRYQESSRVRAF
jgi:hypothetical protein